MKNAGFVILLISLLTNVCNAQETTFEPLGKSGLIRSVIFKGKRYIVCETDPKKYKIETFNQLPDAKGIYTFSEIKKQKKDSLVFAMNGGMFEKDLSPVGLFVAHGKTYKGINLEKDAPGNFYQLKPNGVFMIDGSDKPSVLTSDAYSLSQPKPKLATQSGPMLVVDGIYNANFQEHSPNLNIRNGVGVNRQHHVIFVISAEPVNFYELARLFKTELGCDNALYLDGVVSQYFAPELQKQPVQGSILGTFLTVSRK
jgi:uncharacterized protein YigE (DUF2233 family)